MTMALISAILSQLASLFWKQRVNLRADIASIIAIFLLPSILLYLSSTNSGTATTESTDLIECKIDNFLYCNYPMGVSVSSQFDEDFDSDVNSTSTTFNVAASVVAEKFGSDYKSLFGYEENVDPTTKNAGTVTVENSTSATVFWNVGDNPVFTQKFITLFNEELKSVGNGIQFEETDNPYEYEASTAFDLRIGSFLLLFQAVGGHITSETSSNLYVYFTRAGLLPLVFWSFQYVYYMIIASIAIGIAAIMGVILDKDIQVGAYFVAAWFHVSLAVFFASISKNKKIVNIASYILIIVGFVIPIVFAFTERTEQNRRIYNGFKCIPVFFFSGSVTMSEMKLGCVVSTVLMVLAAYMSQLLAGVSDGMYTGSKVNYLYFLSPKFWQSGIVALPSHTNVLENDRDNGDGQGLVFRNCVKRFGDDKIIGPLTVQLKPGHITTLLGPNGVGKSTLMRVAAGYYIPSEGEMILSGTNTFRESPNACLKSISFCPQDNYLYENMTVEEHLMFMSSLRDMSQVDDTRAHIDWILQTLDIIDKKTTLAKNLSGGMKRRLCLALSTLGFPPVILCDEPSSGVDSINQRGIWKLLETIKNKSAILLTSHSALEAVILSDSVVMMESSEHIIQNNGVEGMAFSIKDDTENKTSEYDVNTDNVEELVNIITSLPNNGSEWKIASKRLSSETLPPLDNILRQTKDSIDDSSAPELQATDEVPETLRWEVPSTLRQITILMSIMLLHPDRLFVLLFMGGGLNFGQIWLSTLYDGFGHTAQLIITPLCPLIGMIASSIIVSQLIEILATERSLGISKLILSQGISRFAYLVSYILVYVLMSYPATIILLIVVGSVHGTSLSAFCIVVIYTSFSFLQTGFCCALGALLEARTAFIMVMILPSFFAIFAQGALSETFADTYPGAIGQVIAGLLIDDVDKKEWTMFIVSIVVNILIGAVSFYIFMARLGNYNLFSNICKKNNEEVRISHEHNDDVENNARGNTDILLEGKAINKTYGVGVQDSASFKALDNVTFAIEKGSLLGLVGKSGAGKSTLMDILSGQLSVSSGAVFVEGKQVVPADIAKVVSVCGQLDTIWPKLKVFNAIAIFMLCRGYKGSIHCTNEITDPYILHLIKELGLQETLKKKVETLSGGQKRRLAFLMSLMGNTKVVLVDEAMTGVDIESRQIMWKILQDEVRLRDRSVVVTSHEMSEVEQYCNTVGILHKGKLVEMGQLSDIKKKWGDSIKLICLFSSGDIVTKVYDVITANHPSIVVELPQIDELDEARIVATYAINLIELKNITGLIYTMDKDVSDPLMLYWSIEPQSLDDFVRSKSRSEGQYA